MIRPSGILESTWIVLLTAALCLFQSCRSVEVTSPPIAALPSLTEANVADVSLSLVSYDSVKIRHTLGSNLQSSNFVGLSIGTKDSSGFKSFLTSSFPYDDNLKAFRVDFTFGVILDASKISFPVTLRYKRVDSSFIDIDTIVLMYKYPYPSAEIFVTSQILRYKNPFDDIALKGSQLFFLVMGDDNLFVYDLVKSVRTDLFYSGGDCIAADSNFVFCDIVHRTIARYNTTTQKVDSSYRLSAWDIAGLEVYDNHLYVLREQKGLYRYTLDFSLVDSIEYGEKHSYYITIDNNILYTTLLESSQIARFDLVTRTFLPYMRAPSRRLSGIRIYQGRLYYCDIGRRIVGSVPLSDLVQYQ